MTTPIQQNERPQSPVTPNMFLVAGMILAAALFRLLPHPPNFTPIGALALFGGAALANRRLALLFPLMAMFLSDLFIGFDKSRLWVYGSIVLITLLGRSLQNRRRPASIAAGSLGASVLFFVVTNFGVWLTSGWYTHTVSEFVRCYAMAVPFFGNMLFGDLVFSGALFGGLAFLESRVLSPAAASLES